MPFLLRMFCQGGMIAGPVLIVVFLIPMGGVKVNGRLMSYAEFWSSGAGASALLGLLMVTFGSWGLAARSPQSRWALVLSSLVPCIPLALFGPADFKGSMLGIIVQGAITAALIYFCLFRLRSVCRYLDMGKPKVSASSV